MLAERHAAGSYAPPTALPAEYMRGGGCFAPWATVEVEGKGATRLDAVLGGDRVRTADGGVAAVRCVVLTPCAGGRAVLVTLPGASRLELTEWHPVLCAVSGRFRFPLLLGGEARLRPCAHVYNLVLERCHVPLVNGVGCASLGHGIVDDPVARHAYWGGTACSKRCPGAQPSRPRAPHLTALEACSPTQGDRTPSAREERRAHAAWMPTRGGSGPALDPSPNPNLNPNPNPNPKPNPGGAVLADLAALPGWAEGRVVLAHTETAPSAVAQVPPLAQPAGVGVC